MSDDRIDELEQRVEELEEVVVEGKDRTLQDSGKTLSVREFIQQHDTSSHQKKVLVIGYFLEKYEGFEKFTSSDLENYYRKAKVQTSSNTSEYIKRCARDGWMMESEVEAEGNQKNWILTQSGELTVEGELKEEEN